MEKVIKEIQRESLGELYIDENIAKHTSMKIGGKVKYLYVPKDIECLTNVMKKLDQQNIKHHILGRGSNTLFSDSDLNIFIIKISNVLNQLTITDNNIYVGSGYSMQKLAKELSKQGYSGLEFAGGIPGTVGGCVCMNAGAHTSDMKSIVKTVYTIDLQGNHKEYTNESSRFSYRESIFKNNQEIITGVDLIQNKIDPALTFKRMMGNLEYRKEMQPLDKHTFGSVFKNPLNHHAGKLIEELGLKGLTVGGAQISEKHANFIVNNGEATTMDVLKLIEYIQEVVLDEYNIILEKEVEVI